MSGAPGCGKTMLARRLPGILPRMSREEALDVTRIHSLAGLLQEGQGLVQQRPFRAPHHNVSTSGLVGGGPGLARPGEVVLANHGVLFLDEMPLFRKDSLEALRAPLEDGKVRIARRAGSVTFPCRFSLVAAMNPCPCGFGGEFPGRCECSEQALRSYRTKVSGPMLDRFDMHVYMKRVPADHLLGAPGAEPSAAIRDRVEAARTIQRRRYGNSVATNASVPRSRLRSEGRFSTDAFPPLRARVEAGNLTGRGVDRVLRLARTIADLNGDDCVGSEHVARALLLRAGSVVAELAA